LDFIHRQHFLFPGHARPVHYDIVACRVCGFAFASDIPQQSMLNSFYQEAEHHLHQEVPSGLSRIHDDFFSFVQHHVPLSESVRVLDIGSGMGHFLSRFKAAGLQKLLGIEPSLAAARLGKEVYGLEIRTETVDAFTPDRSFGLVTLCGVLEHIADLKTSMRRIADLIEEGGHLFIAVPDAVSFGASPPAEAFLEFALEHINFFSATSLDNLLCAIGFEKLAVISQHNDFYDNHYLLALYRKVSKAPDSPRTDGESAASLRNYVNLSRQTLCPVAELAAQLEESGEPVLIWGAGSLTSRLLCDTRLGNANIRGIIDRNKNLQGKQLLGVTISAPESVMDHEGATIFIASTTYAEEIRNTLTRQHGWAGRIVSLAPGVTENR
jgi:SAM-dependent methyltransferase